MRTQPHRDQAGARMWKGYPPFSGMQDSAATGLVRRQNVLVFAAAGNRVRVKGSRTWESLLWSWTRGGRLAFKTGTRKADADWTQRARTMIVKARIRNGADTRPLLIRVSGEILSTVHCLATMPMQATVQAGGGGDGWKPAPGGRERFKRGRGAPPPSHRTIMVKPGGCEDVVTIGDDLMSGETGSSSR